jgi:hypothetical protein
VAARRLVILMLVLLGVSTIAAALVPVDREAGTDETTTTSTPAEKRDDEGGKLVSKSIDAQSKPPRVVRIELGDQLALRVTSRRDAEVEIPAFGELDDVGPGAPALFDLLPFEADRYAVRLVKPRRTIGRIEVEPRKPERRGGKPDGAAT